MQRMVGQLVQELDSLAAFSEVALLAATSRPDLIDAAVLRRFDHIFTVPLPDDHDREAIWRLVLSSEDARQIRELALQRLPAVTEGLTGAAIASAIRRARVIAAGRNEASPLPEGAGESLTLEDLEEALCSITR
jgi:transitional endoplasmic reticulum ATPase